jgi:muramoyltetrapeptide carboxypeptidase LdcA involved in peptidoglycan recycling
MKFARPKRLKKGDTIAVLSPSWGGPSVFPHIYENGLRILKENFGLGIKEYPSTRMETDKIYMDPKIRARDINSAFKDKEVKAIITTIGGDDSIRILRYLDKKVIKANPKIFMGFSDITTLNTVLNQMGSVTFNGPAVMCGFSQMNNFPDYEKHVKEILFNNKKTYEYKPYKEWTMKYPDWSKKGSTGKIENKRKNEGWHWIQTNSKRVTGELYGGCIDTLELIKGTKYWAPLSFWKGKILFFETSEDKPSPDFVKYALRNYGIQGILDKIKGILVGRAREYSKKETKILEENIIKVISKEFNHPDIPIITNIDFGHTDPQIILPLGVKAEIDCTNKTFKLLESPVSD